MPQFEQLEPPAGVKLALKPPELGPRGRPDVQKRASDVIEVIPASEVMDRIKAQQKHKQRPVDLLQEKLQFNQGRVGSCAAEGGEAALIDLEAVEGQRRVLTNPYVTYRNCTRRDDGAALDTVLAHLCDVGAMPDAVWPRAQHDWSEWPPQSLYEHAAVHRIHEFARIDAGSHKAKWEQARTFMLLGKTLVFGHQIYGGGHCEGAVELVDLEWFVRHNSWGQSHRLERTHYSQIVWGYGAYVPLSLVAAGG